MRNGWPPICSVPPVRSPRRESSSAATTAVPGASSSCRGRAGRSFELAVERVDAVHHLELDELAGSRPAAAGRRGGHGHRLAEVGALGARRAREGLAQVGRDAAGCLDGEVGGEELAGLARGCRRRRLAESPATATTAATPTARQATKKVRRPREPRDSRTRVRKKKAGLTPGPPPPGPPAATASPLLALHPAVAQVDQAVGEGAPPPGRG